MGFFDKKYCDVCGEKIGLLGNRKLEDGNLCKDCAAKLSPFFSERKSSTVEEIKQQLFHDVEERLAQFRSTPEYLEYLSQRIQEALDFAGEDAFVVYLDPADQNRIPELAARFGFAPVVSREAFMGGMRAVIRSKNILIDNSFATLLREAKEEFVFAGGMTDE